MAIVVTVFGWSLLVVLLVLGAWSLAAQLVKLPARVRLVFDYLRRWLDRPIGERPWWR